MMERQASPNPGINPPGHTVIQATGRAWASHGQIWSRTVPTTIPHRIPSRVALFQSSEKITAGPSPAASPPQALKT